MKGQNRKVIQAVMKSPSPDVAHRSIITNTKSPANQIKEYMRMRQSSTSPKSMTTSFHQINKSIDNQQINRLKRYISELQAKIKFLQRIKISHQQLAIINQRQNAQISQLKIQLREQQSRGQPKSERETSPIGFRPVSPKGKGVSLVSQNISNINQQNIPAPSFASNDNILRQFNERIVKMSEENKRLAKKLREIKDQKDLLEKQNNILRNLTNGQSPQSTTLPLNLEELKRYFADETDKITNYYQKINETKISQATARINELEDQISKLTQKQNQNLRKVFNRTNSPHELKANISIDTNFKSQNQEDGHSTQQANKYHMIESKYTNSPSQFRALTLDTSPIRVLEEEKQKIRKENEQLSKKTFQLQNELKNALFECNRLQKKLRQMESQTVNKKSLSDSVSSMSKVYQQKNQGLQHEISIKNTELKFKNLTIQELEKRLEEINIFREKQAQNYEKNIVQEREKNQHYLAQIRLYEQKVNEMKESYLGREKYQQIEKQLQNLRKEYDQSKCNFEKYLQMVLQIRYSITGEGVEGCLKEVERKWVGYDELEIEIIKIHECYQAIIQNLKKSILEKEYKIVQLQRENQLLFQSSQQTSIQIQKLEKAIFEYNQPVRTTFSEEQLRKRMSFHQSTSKAREYCQIRDYINTTVSKISDLENEIDSVLKKNQKSQKMYSNLDYMTPVEVESVYQRSTRAWEKENRVREFSDDQFQDPEPSPSEHQ